MNDEARKLLALTLSVVVVMPAFVVVGTIPAAGNTISTGNPSVGNAPMVDVTDATIDPSSDSTIPVSYNAENQGVAASDLSLVLLRESDKTVIKQYDGLPALKMDDFSATIPSGSVSSDFTIDVKLADASGTGLAPLASDTASITVSSGDSTAPTISNVQIDEGASGNVELSFTSNEQLSTLSVTVDGPSTTDAYTFTMADFMESGSGPYTYTLMASQAYDDGDGTYTATIDSATDAAGNDGASGQSDSYGFVASGGDTTAPTIGSVTLQNDGSDNLQLAFQSDEPLGKTTGDIQVTVDGPSTTNAYTFTRSDFTQSGAGPYTYALSTTQAFDDGDGTYTATVDTATDAAGNDGASGQSDTYSLSTGGSDTTPPTISNVDLRDDKSGNLKLTFESDEQLGSSAGDVTVTVDSPSTGTDWQSYDRTDFTEMSFKDAQGNTVYYYELSVTQAYDDGDGVYTATVDDAKDAAGNNGGVNGAGSGLSSTHDTSGPSVQSSSLSIVSGPGDASNIKVDAFYSGLLQIQIKDTGNEYELADDGITDSTVIKATVTVDGAKPRALIGNGHDATWTRTQNKDGTWTVEITAKPSETDYYFPSPGSWPGDLTATDHRDVSLTFASDTLSMLSSQRQSRLDGIVFMTDAQSFAPPKYDDSGANDAIKFDVSAPHYNKSGMLNHGFAEVFIPTTMLNHWGVSANGISGSYNGQERQTTITSKSGGVLAEVSVHYSSGTAAFSVDSTAPTISNVAVSNPSGQDVQVSFDSDEQLSTIDVGISGAESATLTKADFTETDNGDGTYTYTATYSGSSDGDYTGTLNTAADAAGNDGASGQSDTVSVSSGDTIPPSVSNFAVTNPTDRDVKISFDTDEALASISLSISGAESATLSMADFSERANGDGTYTYTAVYAGSTDGDYTAILATAADAAGNDSPGSEFDTVTVDPDTTAPTISGLSVTNPSGQDVTVSFDSDEALASISLSISGAESATFATGAFTETVNVDGTYTYTATYSGSTDGEYTATLSTAADAAGNDGASDQSDAVTVQTTTGTTATLALQANGSTDTSATYDLVIEDATDGIGTLDLDLTLSDGGDATITDVHATDSVSVSLDGANRSATLTGSPATDAQTLTVATVTVERSTPGTTTVSATAASSLTTPDGADYDGVDPASATLTMAEPDPNPTLPGMDTPAVNTDDDPLLEDVNGDDEEDVFDALAYYDARDSDVVQNNPDLFDYDGDGTPGTLFDALALFNELSE